MFLIAQTDAAKDEWVARLRTKYGIIARPIPLPPGWTVARWYLDVGPSQAAHVKAVDRAEVRKALRVSDRTLVAYEGEGIRWADQWDTLSGAEQSASTVTPMSTAAAGGPGRGRPPRGRRSTAPRRRPPLLHQPVWAAGQRPGAGRGTWRGASAASGDRARRASDDEVIDNPTGTR